MKNTLSIFRLEWGEYLHLAEEGLDLKSLLHISEKCPNDEMRKEASLLLHQYICLWCNTQFGHTLVTDSHGICPVCLKKQLAKKAA